MTEDYKILEINGVKYFPENAVHMLIDEAKKLIHPNKHPEIIQSANVCIKPEEEIIQTQDLPHGNDGGYSTQCEHQERVNGVCTRCATVL